MRRSKQDHRVSMLESATGQPRQDVAARPSGIDFRSQKKRGAFQEESAATFLCSDRMLRMISVSAMVLLSFSVSLVAMDPNSTNPNNLELSGVVADAGDASTGKWLDSFENAKKLSIEKNIPIILHFEAVWCGACRTMDSAVLSQQDVIRHLGSTVIGVRVDADRDPDLIAKYGISSLPTEVVIGSDGKELARYAGSATLSEYTARLDKSGASKATGQDTSSPQELDENLRRCLLVMRDGKVVGLGGFCPVAMMRDKKWLKGSEEFVGSFDGVDYFFQSAVEREVFFASPKQFVPGLHGCDPVELQRGRRAETGAIELGAFYKGRVFFFTSQSNRRLFKSNPAWYAEGVSADGIQNPERFPFLKSMNLN
ncbi:MAG: thioredoxin domain-containing protein [Planctomycetaceae bacterium]